MIPDRYPLSSGTGEASYSIGDPKYRTAVCLSSDMMYRVNISRGRLGSCLLSSLRECPASKYYYCCNTEELDLGWGILTCCEGAQRHSSKSTAGHMFPAWVYPRGSCKEHFGNRCDFLLVDGLQSSTRTTKVPLYSSLAVRCVCLLYIRTPMVVVFIKATLVL